MGGLNVIPRSLVTLKVTEHVLANTAGAGVSLLDQRPCAHNAVFEPGLLTPKGSQRIRFSSLYYIRHQLAASLACWKAIARQAACGDGTPWSTDPSGPLHSLWLGPVFP